MTECTSAQQAISAASDGELHDAALLEAAELHCRECAQCAAYAEALTAMRGVPVTPLPAGVLDRALEAVRAEYPSPESAKEAHAEQSPAHSGPVDALSHPPDTAPPTRATLPRLRPMPGWAPWAAAAAILLVAAGTATTYGVRSLLQPMSASTYGDSAVPEEAVESREVAGEGAGESAAPMNTEDAESSAAPPEYVVFNERVYILSAQLSEPATGTPVGSVTTALDTGEAPIEHSVHVGEDPDAITVAVDDSAALVFKLVTRSLRGSAYVLRSGPVKAFGDWPTLPPDIAGPAGHNVSSAFVEMGTDDLGVTVYVRRGTSTSRGFAVAPGTAANDPAGGNTGWTWWEPQR